MKTIVITGASDGIGKVAAQELVKMGHEVIVVGRTPSKVEKVASELNAKYFIADYSKLEEVVALAKELNKLPKIDVLINNAGGILNKRTDTVDGIEKTFQVNVLSMFLLTELLMDKLSESKATVISTTSIAANLFTKHFDINDIQNVHNYSSKDAYGEAKLEDLLLTKEFHNRYHVRDINFTAFEPGIPRTNFAFEGNRFFKFMYHSIFKYLFTSKPLKSAKRMIALALGEEGKDFKSGTIYQLNGKVYKEKFKVSKEDQAKVYEICKELCSKYLD